MKTELIPPAGFGTETSGGGTNQNLIRSLIPKPLLDCATFRKACWLIPSLKLASNEPAAQSNEAHLQDFGLPVDQETQDRDLETACP